jgi:hypothetical protein
MLAVFGTSVRGATLRWNANPEPDVAFYTVYAESASGTSAREVHEGTELILDGWLGDGSYVLHVTATSTAGLESERSEGIPYSVEAPVAAPTITGQPNGAVLASGSALTMTVSVASESAATYEWRKDGAVVTGQGEATFSKTNISEEDSGIYTVTVSNAGGSVTSEPAQVVVQVTPSISMQPQSASVAEGGNVELTVGASGTALSYRWFKNGEVLPGETSATLAIGNVTGDDEGNYQVVVTNLVGSASSSVAAITVIYPPAILAGPVGTNVATGGTIQLSVGVSGTAPFTYQWLKDGEPMANATGAEWLITGAGIDDSGSYQVRVGNAAGSVTSGMAVVSVLDKPGIVGQPSSQDVLEGGSLLLGVVAQGSGALSYQWYLNDLPIAGATDADYEVPSVVAGNAGEYQVVVSNEVGSVTSQKATVRVFPRITIVQQPASTNVQVGERLVLAVEATGPEGMNYQWYQGAIALSGETNAQFEIAQIRITDSGSYTVEISSVVETKTSVAALVTVSGTAPSIVAHPQSTQVLEGGQVQLAVSATGTDLSYQWLKDEAPISGAISSSLLVSEISLADQGSYRVRVSNAFGSVLSEPAFVSILWPPRIVQSPASTNLGVGGTIQLVVSASGTAPFTYEWLKDGVVLTGATNALLVISAATTNHSGGYEARVSNGAGTATSGRASVTVIGVPTIVSQPAGGEFLEGTAFTLSVTATSAAAISYQWFQNDSAVEGATGSTFHIASASNANAGSYTVRVSNMAGFVMSTAAAVQILPSITILEPPTSTNLNTGGQVKLTVKASGPSGMSYQWYRDGVKLSGKTSSELTIENASTADAGVYTVEVSSTVEQKTSPAAQVTITESPSGGVMLTMTVSSTGSLRITGVAPANTNYELQRTDSLTTPNWQRIQNVSTRSEGRFEVTISTSQGSGFIRTVRR